MTSRAVVDISNPRSFRCGLSLVVLKGCCIAQYTSSRSEMPLKGTAVRVQSTIERLFSPVGQPSCPT
ncbi:MAG: hypothetical protein AAFX94_16005, partial [Myxococcota bacterium]